ncbi:ABC transporter substrate-binding protein [Nocardioides acrostichi]|uniref:ABC transporter substrate-binding protein n=1 Tax=Nocardioides acrostichi TaxID=2784339 RepID=A0A930UYM0_9ACTN|nr:ABC transporter substrate-binding protein [Nocardioides acrostichi]MBF4161455.1 ABC transporter substrate-binding protein [Nocardioides acrostichi]
MIVSRFLRAVCAMVLVTAAVACGSADRTEGAKETASASSDDAVFPVSVEHRFGETVVPARPQRVVSVGVTEQDVLLQLGIVPVAVTEWYGDQPDATWPWAHDLLDGAHPEVLTTSDGFEIEKIAALDPDLIIGVNAGMTEQDYRTLSQIAPTVVSVPGSTRYFSPWRDQVRQIARAVGREAEGDRIVDAVAQRYAEVAADHPQWQGMTATFSQGGPSDNQLYVYPDGLSTEFLSDLGFTMTKGLEKFAADSDSQALISAENVGLIDADVIVFATESREQFDQLQDFGTVPLLEAVAENRAVYTDEVMAGATYFSTPLSLDYLLERLTPMLEAASQGKEPRAYPS